MSADQIHDPDKPIGEGPPSAEIPEEKLRDILKTRYGIEDDPETYKKRVAGWRKAEAEIPQYQNTLAALIEMAKAQEKPLEKAPVADTVEEDRRIAALDPYEGFNRLFSKRKAEFDLDKEALRKEMISAGKEAAQAERVGARADAIVTKEWPEARDTTTDLHKLGKQIYFQEMSDWERAKPDGYLAATERAAARLGMAPASRRKDTGNRGSEVASQNVGGGQRRPPPKEEDMTLSEKEKRMAEDMGLDEKGFKAAKLHRMKLKEK